MGPDGKDTAQAAVYIDGQPVQYAGEITLPEQVERPAPPLLSSMGLTMELFYSAFLQKNELFPPPELAAEPTEAEKEEWEDVERAWKIQSMMGGLDRHTRHKALEAAE